MINVIKYSSLGTLDYEWLNAHYHFSFGNYYDPNRIGFGTIRVINDDIIKADHGFDMHSHRNMEIITYVRSGEIIHQDSMGNKGVTPAGDVQVMSAGSGVCHSEFASEGADATVYQIWIQPNQNNVKPRWDQRKFSKEFVKDALNLLISGEADDALLIYQDAKIYGGRLAKGAQIYHPVTHQAYVLISDGTFMIGDQVLSKGRAAQVTGQDRVFISASTDAEILVIDAPSQSIK